MRRKGEEVEKKEEGKRKKKRKRAIKEEVIERVQKKRKGGERGRKENIKRKRGREGKNWRIQRGILECVGLNNNRFLEGIGRVGRNNTFGNMNG